MFHSRRDYDPIVPSMAVSAMAVLVFYLPACYQSSQPQPATDTGSEGSTATESHPTTTNAGASWGPTGGGSTGVTSTSNSSTTASTSTDATDCQPDCADRNCGSDGCGGICGTCPETAICSSQGRCQCPAGQTLCDEGCRDLGSDPQHCGTCEQACTKADHAEPSCVAGTCQLACTDDWLDCDGEFDNGCESQAATWTNSTNSGKSGVGWSDISSATTARVAQPFATVGQSGAQLRWVEAYIASDVAENIELSVAIYDRDPATGEPAVEAPRATHTIVANELVEACLPQRFELPKPVVVPEQFYIALEWPLPEGLGVRLCYSVADDTPQTIGYYSSATEGRKWTRLDELATFKDVRALWIHAGLGCTETRTEH